MAEGALQARDRLAFLLALVPYLMDHDRVSVAEAAAHFDVSPAFLRESVRLIAVSGVPGETRSYQHEDLFDISWEAFEDRDEIVLTHQVAIDDSPRFSAREAAALIAGLQYLSSVPGDADREDVTALMAKLSRGASAEPSELAVRAADSDGPLAGVREAIARGRRLEFRYIDSKGERKDRRVDPLRVESVDRDWYLRAWDHSREAVRTFRLDRMSDLTVSDEPVSREAATIDLPEALFEPSADDLAVDVAISAVALPLVQDWAPEATATSEAVVRATVRVAHHHGLKRLAAEHAGLVTVLGPPDARRAVADWARAGLDRYDPAD